MEQDPTCSKDRGSKGPGKNSWHGDPEKGLRGSQTVCLEPSETEQPFLGGGLEEPVA